MSSDSPFNYIQRSNLKKFNHRYMLKVDVDSVYFGHNSFQELMKGFGGSVKSFVDSCKTRLDNSGSSRFGLCLKNNGYAKVQIDVNGVYPDKIRLDYLPNMKLMECQVNDISPRFYINMYFVGVGKMRPTTYFRNVEVKAVTALLNVARENSIAVLKASLMLHNQGTNNAKKRAAQVELETFCDMHLFESITGGTQDKRIKNRPTCLSNNSARIFASEFDRALEKYATCNDEEFEKIFSSSVSVGSHRKLSNRAMLQELAEMRAFLIKLKRGVFFCASCAGCKQDFYRNTDSQVLMEFDSTNIVTTRRSSSDFQAECERLKELALKQLKLRLFGDIVPSEEEGERIEEERIPFYHNIDIGIEISPVHENDSFLLMGRAAKNAAREMLKERNRWWNNRGARTGPDALGNINGASTNPHVLGSNLVLSREDRDLLDFGTMLRFSNDRVFEYGYDEEENAVPAQGKVEHVCNHTRYEC